MDGVGLFCFGPESEAEPTTYLNFRVPRQMGMDQVFYRACQDLVALRDQAPEPIPYSAVGPAAGAQAALESLGPEAAVDPAMVRGCHRDLDHRPEPRPPESEGAFYTPPDSQVFWRIGPSGRRASGSSNHPAATALSWVDRRTLPDLARTI